MIKFNNLKKVIFLSIHIVLGHDPALINLYIKIRTDNNGQQIA